MSVIDTTTDNAATMSSAEQEAQSANTAILAVDHRSTMPVEPIPLLANLLPPGRPYSPSRTPTSAEIDAVIAAAIANAPPPPPQQPEIDRSTTPLMTNLLPSAVGVDGRVNLFVGNLPYRVRWQDLKDLFRKAGTVLRADVSLGPDNRSRGFGTVLMGSREDAARAIDRFNGYTWQTRTLEVRPDRLPPEYEAQTHQVPHHAPPRPPMFNHHNPSHQNHPGHPSFNHPPFHGGQGWHPSHHQPRPIPVSQGMHHHFSLPHHGPPPSHPMSMAGSSPIPHSLSPAPGYGPGMHPIPLSGQNTGTYQPLGASPLAGSLTSGTGPTGGVHQLRRDSLSPFVHAVSPENGAPSLMLHRSTSPLSGAPGATSRPSSSHDQSTTSSTEGASRHGPPGSLGHLPPAIFAGARAIASPPESGGGSDIAPSQSNSMGPTPPLQPKAVPAGPPVAIAMEGLSHQGAHMGPPSTLHDRVVFVSGLPLSMQWQELKDLLRPAGLIIRADVATDGEGRPRGFGTALFASEHDARSAVQMYNGRDISGHKIRVSLERVIIEETISRRSSSVASALGYADSTGPSSAQESGISVDTSSDPDQATTQSPVAARVPWTLNTGYAHATPGRHGQHSPEDATTPQQTYRHHPPGPISMPIFVPLDSPGHNPLSPLLTRGLPPMTPSMPGFHFNAYPETPPIHPHFMGPFSPGIPVTSPGGFQYNPFMNAAPGAPVNRYPQAGSAALGTPTTQVFPNNPIHGSLGHGQRGQPSLGQIGDYFPTMHQQHYPSNPSDSSTSSPHLTPTATRPPPIPSPLNARDRLASTSSVGVSGLTNGQDAGDIAKTIGSLSLDVPDASSVPGTGPPSPTKSYGHKATSGDLGGSIPSITGGAISTENSSANAPISRASVDGSRPNLGVWDLTAGNERRASFGDVVAGRANGSKQ